MDTVEAICLGFPMDKRDYGVAQILNYLGIRRLRLISNNPKKRTGLSAYGLEIIENIPVRVHPAAYEDTWPPSG
jgi:3,4-dihydroxy 2-butanone 4-phosphate synthase/GTP cyclohydrolase II